MPDFTNVSALHKVRKTTKVAIEGIEGFRPVLECLPANESNSGYFDALLKRQRRSRSRRVSAMSAKVLKKFRNDDRELMAMHCVLGWEPDSVIDAHGDVIDFSKAACWEFFKALPDDLFDEVREEITDPASFFGEEDPADIEETGGN